MADDAALRVTGNGDLSELIIAGEIDEFSYPALVQSLADAAQAGNGDVHIDLAGVEYCDLAGLRAIVCVTGSASDIHPSRHVVLHAVPPQLRKILQILGWDTLPGVAVDEGNLPHGVPAAG